MAVLVSGTATSAVVARALGPSGRGTLAVAFAMTLMLVQFGSFGLATANPYYAARDSRAVAQIVANSLWLALMLGAALTAVGFGVKAWFPSVVEGLGWAELAVALLGVMPALAGLFLQSILLGEGRMLAYNAVELAQAVLTLVALVLGFWIFDLGVLGALAVMVAGLFGSAFGYLGVLRQYLPRLPRADPRLVKEMLRYGFRIYIATLLAFLVIRLDILLVNSFLGAAEAGLYSLVAALGEGMVLLPTVIAVNLFPRVARSGGHDLSAHVFRATALLFGAACLMSIPLAGPAIRLVFGPDFAPATELYYWLLPGLFSLGMLTILSHHFAGRGFPLEAMVIWFVGLGVNLAINFAFLAEGGTWVASLASTVAYSLLLVLHVRLFSRESGGYLALLPRFSDVLNLARLVRPRSS